MRARLLVWLLGVVLLACDPPVEAPAAPPALERAVEEALTPDALLPLAIGDRWRERISDGGERTRGVTAHTLEGVAVVFGQLDRRPSFFRADATEAGLVDPQGRLLEPLLRAPVRAGASFRYTLGEGPIAAACTAEVVGTGARVAVGGGTLEGCVRVVRQCVHPAGIVFDSETTRRSEETYCPGVGRVRVEQTLDPPLPGSQATSTVELVAFRVAGAPVTAPPARFGCDAVFLLPSDVAAACGPEWRFVGEESAEGGCVHRFATDEGTLEVRVSRRRDAAEATNTLDALLGASGGASGAEGPLLGEARHAEREGVHVLGGTEGAHLVVVETRGCPPDQAARLVPFVRSLVADER